jgi:hypothetical protein
MILLLFTIYYTKKMDKWLHPRLGLLSYMPLKTTWLQNIIYILYMHGLYTNNIKIYNTILMLHVHYIYN